MTDHEREQKKVINEIEKQIKVQSLQFSTVSPPEDYESDPRICLTSVHIPHDDLKRQVQQICIDPLRKVEPDLYYYPVDSLHMTIKNIRTINDPPHFTKEDIKKAEKVFSEVIPKHKQFNVYFYKLLLFPNNLALIGTTDQELDTIIFDLDSALNKAGIPDDKVYINTKYFFCNMTLARFNAPPSEKFKQKVQELSYSIEFNPYTIDTVTLLTCNAVFKKRRIINSWQLKKNI